MHDRPADLPDEANQKVLSSPVAKNILLDGAVAGRLLICPSC
jgi:hypothetical protein